MRWSINIHGKYTGDSYDDGICAPQSYESGPGPGPGDDGFSRDLIDARLAQLGEGYTADYMGQSWPLPDEGRANV